MIRAQRVEYCGLRERSGPLMSESGDIEGFSNQNAISQQLPAPSKEGEREQSQGKAETRGVYPVDTMMASQRPFKTERGFFLTVYQEGSNGGSLG